MGVHAHQDRRRLSSASMSPRTSATWDWPSSCRAVGDHAEVAVARGDDGLALALDEALVGHAVADDLGGGDHLEIVLAAELDEFGNARHGAVVAHDFADDAGGVESGHARQIDAGLGLSGADEHAAGAGAQRKDVAGAHQVAGARSGIDGDLDGAGAVGGADAGGDALARFDGFGEGGAEGRLVGAGHGSQPQEVAALLGEREADEPAAEAGHEVDGLGGDFFGGHGEVAFVLAVLVVHDDDHAPGAHLLQRRGNITKGRVGLIHSGF